MEHARLGIGQADGFSVPSRPVRPVLRQSGNLSWHVFATSAFRTVREQCVNPAGHPSTGIADTNAHALTDCFARFDLKAAQPFSAGFSSVRLEQRTRRHSRTSYDKGSTLRLDMGTACSQASSGFLFASTEVWLAWSLRAFF